MGKTFKDQRKWEKKQLQRNSLKEYFSTENQLSNINKHTKKRPLDKK